MRTPLYEKHRQMGARTTTFAGWEMPLYYSSIVHEALLVRSTAAIFDLSHLGRIIVSGPGALDTVQYVTTNDAAKLAVGQAQYTLMCSESGGVLEDLVVYRTRTHAYMLAVNAANTASDFRRISLYKEPETEIEDQTESALVLAVQGPASVELLGPLAEFEINSLKGYWGCFGRVAGVQCWTARTGYTGEDGFELYCRADDGAALWDTLIKSGKPLGIEPAGLGARDILRLEAGYPLYGSELTASTTPVDARLLWVVKFDKGDFLGRDAVLTAKEAGPRELLVGLEAEGRCIPRHSNDVLVGENRVGCVTSGTFSPTLGKPIAMAYVKPEHSQIGGDVDVLIRGRPCRCRVVRPPFYRKEQTGSTGKLRSRRMPSAP